MSHPKPEEGLDAGRALLDRRLAIVPRGVPMVSEATVASARGAVLTDLTGRPIIDFAGGIGTVNAGHCAPAVTKAIQDQSERLLHVCFHVATYEPYVALCEKLAELLPHGERTKVLLVNTGAEAVENAVKIARQATGRPAVICFTDGFHGRTMMGMSLTSNVKYKRGCGPFAPEVYRLPFPNAFRRPSGQSEEAFGGDELRRLRAAFKGVVAAEDVAAIIIEPVLGEGGFVPVPAAYLRGLREICDETGILLVLDEVQTGFCRTGHWAAFQHFGVTPDISTYAKSLGDGLPIAAVVGRAEVMDGAAPGTIGGTFGGNPVSCAAAMASIGEMERLDLNARAGIVGSRVRARFEAVQAGCPSLIDVRGIGAMIGAEFTIDGDPLRPAGEGVREVLRSCLARGVLVISAGTTGSVIRVLSPLTIADEDLEYGLSVLEEEIVRVFPAGPRPAA